MRRKSLALICLLFWGMPTANAETITLTIPHAHYERLLGEVCEAMHWCGEPNYRMWADWLIKLATRGRESVDTLEATVEITR